MFKTKLTAGIVVIVALGLLALFYVYRNLGQVAGYLATLDRVSVPFSISALEMEKNVGEYATGVQRYLRDPASPLRVQAVDDIRDFNRHHGIYMLLSTNDHERALGSRVEAEHQKLIAAGNALMSERDRLDTIFKRTADRLEQIDRLLDGPLLATTPVPQVDHGVARTALQDVEAETAELGFWLTLFKFRPSAQARAHVLAKVREQQDAVARMRRLPLGDAARKHQATLLAMQRQVAASVRELLAGETAISVHVQQFERLATLIDDIFDDEMQPMLVNDLSEPYANADRAIQRVQTTLRYLIPIYLLIAAMVGLLLFLAIVRPLKRLAAGTQALGGGNLEHRIEARGRDEFGTLARQFNLMAERLKDSTVSRGLLEASQQQLQQSVIELRQEMAERQQAEREREKLQLQLRRSETLAAMGQLVAGVAHEVRNPLFGISSTLDAMEANAGLSRMNPRYREVLRRETERLNKLMTDLLEFGRAAPAAHTAQPLGETLADAIRNCREAAKAADVTITNQSVDDALVEMNRDRMVQVHVNLIENALAHAPPGSEVTITTRAFIDEDGRQWIDYSVLDAGRGIQAEDLPRLFEPFFTRRPKGTGLGLAIVRRIVDEHHGSIEAANRPEGGAVMTVRLPSMPFSSQKRLQRPTDKR